MCWPCGALLGRRDDGRRRQLPRRTRRRAGSQAPSTTTAGSISPRHGWFPDRPGNYHTGDIEVEEDDDGVTGFLQDWRCTGDAVPPQPYSNDPGRPALQAQAVGRPLRSSTALLNLGDLRPEDQPVSVSTSTSRRLDWDTNEPDGGSVRIDLTIVGKGAPTIYKATTPTTAHLRGVLLRGRQGMGPRSTGSGSARTTR